ncbi:MAG: glycosyltransferase family 2 protein [Thermodesulfobacteria bacterium]|nr:glycosyltransferase family 2 protein [Thermodesulfobacteriota bacterium]
MGAPRVACIIPVRNRRQMVLAAIDSALNQSRRPDEIIVIDDGSRDGTSEAIFKKLPDVILIKGGGMGPGRARNLGASVATSDVFMFLDSDDLWLPNHVETLLAPLCRGGHCSFGVTLNLGMNDSFTIPGDEFDRKLSIFSNLLRWCCLVPSSFAITREAFVHSGGFPSISLGEDWLFFVNLAVKFDLYFVPEIVTHRRLHGENLCWSTFSKKRAMDICEKLIQTALDNDMQEERENLFQMKRLIAKEGEKWKSVQDWYLSLKKNGLI